MEENSRHEDRCPNCGRPIPAETRLEDLRERVDLLTGALREIEQWGHDDYHGRGYSLADIAAKALAQIDGDEQ